MKTSRLVLVLAVTLIALAGFSNLAMARSHVSIGVGFGFPGFYGGYYGGGHHGWHGGHSSVFIGGSFPLYDPYYYEPYYYAPPVIVEPPVVVQRPVVIERPPIVERQPVYVQSQDNFAAARERKSSFLRELNSTDKSLRMNAIRNLVGFSYDDNVRIALENVILSDNDPDIRIAVANAFGSVKNMKVLPTLERIRIDDENADVRKACDIAINNINRN